MEKSKFMAIILFLFVFCLAMPAQGGQSAPALGVANSPAKTEPPAGKSTEAAPDHVVLRVGDQQVTARDFDYLLSVLNPQAKQTVASMGRRPIGDQYAMALALAQEAVRDHLDATPDFRRQLEFQKTQALAQAALQNLSARVKVTSEEASKYYSTNPTEFDQIDIRQIGVRKKVANSPKDAPGLSPEDARTRFDAIRKALAAGTDVKKVAEDFKIANVVTVELETHTVRHGQLPAELDKAAFHLKDGELSEPLDNQQGLYCIQVVGHSHRALQDASQEIENKLKQERVQAAVDDVKKKASIWMDQEYFKPSQAAPAAAAPSAAVPHP